MPVRASCSPNRLTITWGRPVTWLGTEETGIHYEALETGLKGRVRAEEPSSSADAFRDRKASSFSLDHGGGGDCRAGLRGAPSALSAGMALGGSVSTLGLYEKVVGRKGWLHSCEHRDVSPRRGSPVVPRLGGQESLVMPEKETRFFQCCSSAFIL